MPRWKPTSEMTDEELVAAAEEENGMCVSAGGPPWRILPDRTDAPRREADTTAGPPTADPTPGRPTNATTTP